MTGILSQNNDVPWMADGACVGQPTDYWFPPVGANDVGEMAKRICAACSVQDACLDYSLTQPSDLYGIWAGLNRGERQALRGRLGRAAA